MFEGEEKSPNSDMMDMETNLRGSPAEMKYKMNPPINYSPNASVHSGRSSVASEGGKPSARDMVTPTKKNKKKKDRPKTSFFNQIFDLGGNRNDNMNGSNSKDNSVVDACGGGGVGSAGSGAMSPLFDAASRRKSSTEKIALAASILGQIMSRKSLTQSPVICDDDDDSSATQTIIPGSGYLKMASAYFRRDSRLSDDEKSMISSKHSLSGSRSNSRREKNTSGRKSFVNVIRMSLHASMQPLASPPSRNTSFSNIQLPKGFVRIPGWCSYLLSSILHHR